eukprot:comp11671_c0_seq1/m.6198 comp11671_c0_seq1/g.6198  ORF comp11671_c0_seq1/g.6198 comp11671_c0_seq1/m.6198 type:complete len:151 (-) comp11671_c0_seq1:636-1088(-)
MANPTFTRRVQKELKEMSSAPPPGVTLRPDANLECWLIDIVGAEGTLYAGEKYTLQIKFGSKYPFEAPEVVFVGQNIPVHHHIYGNGHICLNILYQHWSPALSVQSICLSILSMLSSATEKKRPPDNDSYVVRAKKSPKDTSWWYHDDTV